MGLRKFTDISDGLSPQEFYEKHSFPNDARCQHCKTPRVSVRSVVFWPMSDVVKDGVMTAEQVANGAGAPLMLQLRDPVSKSVRNYIRYSMAYACTQCAPAMEKVLARDLPSYVVVDITRGPDPLNRVTVGRSQRS